MLYNWKIEGGVNCDLVTALVDDNKFLSSEGLLIDDVHYSAKFFIELRCSHIKREDNKIAHNLVWYVLYILNFIVRIEDVPSSFLTIVQVDITNFS